MKPWKQYFMRYESDQMICGQYDHLYGYASTVKTCKQYIRNCKKREAQYNPRNFRIYDSFADIDPKTGFVPVVYSEA